MVLVKRTLNCTLRLDGKMGGLASDSGVMSEVPATPRNTVSGRSV